MKDRPLSELAAGARSLANAVIESPNVDEAGDSTDEWEPIVTDERCTVCSWPEVCAADRTCWEDNKRSRREHDEGHRQARAAAPEAKGQPKCREPKWTRDKIVQAFIDFHTEHGRAPRQTDLRAPMPGPGIVHSVVGGMHAACEAAGIQWARRAGPQPTFTVEGIVAAGVRWFDEHGRPPSARDWNRGDAGWPTYDGVRRQMGLWTTFQEALGQALAARAVREVHDGDAAPAPDRDPDAAELVPLSERASGASPEGDDGAAGAAPKPPNGKSTPRPEHPDRLIDLAHQLEELDRQIAVLALARAEVADLIRERLDR